MERAASQTVIGRRLARRAVAVVESARPRVEHDAPVDLTLPGDAQPPAVVLAAANRSLDAGETHYTERNGIPRLCAALAARLTAAGFPAGADSVVITNGGSEALYIALQSVVQPGDRVLLAGPVSPDLGRLIAFIGGQAVRLATTAANRFNPSAEEIEDQQAAVLLLSSPSPITGVAIAPDELEAIVEAAIERGMTVILDRTRAWCCYDPALTHFDTPELGRQLLLTGSFSDVYAMGGWRAGYVAAPDQHAPAMLELKQAMSICTSSITQHAALAALEEADDWLAERRATLLARRDAVIGRLDAAGLPAITPDAWPYLLLDTRLIHPDDPEAASMLRQQAGVEVEPASIYSLSLAGYTRIRLDADEAALDEGIERLIGFHSTCI